MGSFLGHMDSLAEAQGLISCLGMQASLLHSNKQGMDWDFPGDSVAKNPPCNAGDMSLITGEGTKILHAA